MCIRDRYTAGSDGIPQDVSRNILQLMAIAIGYYRVWFKDDDSNTEAQWFKMTLRRGSVRPSIRSINREEALWWIKSRKMKDVTPGNPAGKIFESDGQPFKKAFVPGSQAACLFCEIDFRLPALSRTDFGWLAENLPPRTKRRVYFPHPPCLARPLIPQAEKQSAFGTGQMCIRDRS